MRISKLHILPFGVIMLAIAFACSPRDKAVADNVADSLYRQTVAITRDYTARIRTAKDSAAADSLFGRYRDIIDSINFKYPANTDLLLTEGQNDTLTYLSRRLVETHARRMKSIEEGRDTAVAVHAGLENSKSPQ